MTDDIVTQLRNIAASTGNISGAVIPMACNDAANEIERLQADIGQRAKLMSQIVQLLMPFSMLMNKHEQELLLKAMRGEIERSA